MQYIHFKMSPRIISTLIFILSLQSAFGSDVSSDGEESSTNSTETSEEYNFRYNDPESIRPHYALHPRKSKQLALLEENLIASLKKEFINQEDPISQINSNQEYSSCHKNLFKYISQYDEDIDAVSGQNGVIRAKIVSENPILTFKMVRTVVVTLLNETIKTSCKNWNNVTNIVEETFFTANLTPPTEKDLKDAVLGIVRIQYIYGFDAMHLQKGIFNGTETNAHLNFLDCLALAQKALELEGEILAYQWLSSAMSCSEENLGQNDIHELEMTLQKLMNMSGLLTIDELHNNLDYKNQQTLKSFKPYRKYASCREGIGITEYKKLPSNLTCFNMHDWNPYFYINPVKTEILSENPPIFQFYEFVGDKVIARIRQLTTKSLARSSVASSDKKQADFVDFSTSMSVLYADMWIKYPDPVLVNLNRRIEKLTGLELVKVGASIMQMVLYGGVGGYTDFHLDSLQRTFDPYDEEGDRLATFLIFTSDVTMGGFTAFYKLGIHAKPVKGSAIFWFNLWRNGKPDIRSAHAGCPVILGYKEVVNRWIHENDNMWKSPCSLSSIE